MKKISFIWVVSKDFREKLEESWEEILLDLLKKSVMLW